MTDTPSPSSVAPQPLPELPEPAGDIRLPGAFALACDGFSADQMYHYARAAIYADRAARQVAVPVRPAAEAQGEAVAKPFGWHYQTNFMATHEDHGFTQLPDMAELLMRNDRYIVTPVYDHPASPSSAAAQAVPNPSVPLSAIRPIAVEAIRAITGCPDVMSGDRSLVEELESVAKAAAKTLGNSQAVPTTGDLDSNTIFDLADQEAENSAEDGKRTFTREGLLAFAGRIHDRATGEQQ